MDRGQRPRRHWRRPPIAALAGVALIAGLAVLHGRLLWQRVADGSLLQPTVAARWIASGLVAWVMLWLWSRGLPLLSGRRAAVLWLVVLLLHVGMPGAPLPAIVPAAPALLAPVVVVAVALLGLRSVTGRPRRTRPVGVAGDHFRARPWPTGWSAALYSRPPPAPLRS